MYGQYNGDQALAYGAIAANVKLVTGYPGSPSTATLNTLIELASEHDIYVEWSTNERVAVEIAIGASIAGRRALVCTKSVGMNVMLDPLMCLNLSGVHGGIVILLGDDPGAYGSQNEQDTRQLAPMLELPMLEPATPAEGYAMMLQAFKLSEHLKTAIVIHETRAFTQFQESFEPDLSLKGYSAPLGLVREPYRFVPYPGNAVQMHRQLHQRLDAFETWANESDYNQIIGEGAKGIIAAGFAYRKLRDICGDQFCEDLRVLKLGCLYPLPGQVIQRFARGCREILIFEEVDPYIETHIKAILFDAGITSKVKGKLSGHVNWEGELFRWHIQKALEEYLPAFKPARQYLAADEAAEKPHKANHCANYHYETILDLLLEEAQELKQQPIIIADPGCMVKVAGQLDAKFAIGSATAIASGIRKSGINEQIVAFFGDSAFFHSALPAICNAAYNQSNILMVLLDNSGAGSTGLQPTPASGINIHGDPTPKLSIPTIAEACGVDFVQSIAAGVAEDELKNVLRAGLKHRGLALLVIGVEPNIEQSP